MARISRHAVDVEDAHDAVAYFAENIVTGVNDSRVDLAYCNKLRIDAEKYAGYLLFTEPESPEVCRALRIGAQAVAAVFAAAMATTPEVEVTIGDGPPARVPTKGAKDAHHAPKWLQGFFIAAICREREILDLLCRVPIDLLRACKGIECNEYDYLFVAALQAFYRQQDDAPQRLLAALEATDPEHVFVPEYAFDIVVPQMELLLRLMDRDAEGFNKALQKALELHKKYWSKTTQHRNRDARAYIALGITALASFAYEAGLPIEIESDYLPMRLVRGDCHP